MIDLKKSLEAKADTKIISESGKQIIFACDELIQKYGSQKEVKSFLESAKRTAIRITLAAQGRMGLGNSGPFKYELGMVDLNSIERDIQKIASILQIEIAEINS